MELPKWTSYGSISVHPNTLPALPTDYITPTKRKYLIAILLLALAYLLDWDDIFSNFLAEWKNIFSNFLALILSTILFYAAENEINQKGDSSSAIGLIVSTVILVDGVHVVKVSVFGSCTLLILEWLVIRKISCNEQNKTIFILMIATFINVILIINVINSESNEELLSNGTIIISSLIFFLGLYFYFTCPSTFGALVLLSITVVVVVFAKKLVGSIKSQLFGLFLLPIVNNFFEIITTSRILYYNRIASTPRTPETTEALDKVMICIIICMFILIVIMFIMLVPRLNGFGLAILLVVHVILRYYWQKIQKVILKNMNNII